MGKMLWQGAKLGASTGFILAASFTNCLVLAIYFTAPASGFIITSQYSGMLVFAWLYYGYLIGVLPATLLGAVIGLLTSLGLKKPLPSFAASLLGPVVALIIILLINLAGFSTSNVLLIIPVSICIFASGWVGFRLNRANSEDSEVEVNCFQIYWLVVGASLLSVLLPGFVVIPLLPVAGLFIARKFYEWRQMGVLFSALYTVFLLLFYSVYVVTNI